MEHIRILLLGVSFRVYISYKIRTRQKSRKDWKSGNGRNGWSPQRVHFSDWLFQKFVLDHANSQMYQSHKTLHLRSYDHSGTTLSPAREFTWQFLFLIQIDNSGFFIWKFKILGDWLFFDWVSFLFRHLFYIWENLKQFQSVPMYTYSISSPCCRWWLDTSCHQQSYFQSHLLYQCRFHTRSSWLYIIRKYHPHTF